MNIGLPASARKLKASFDFRIKIQTGILERNVELQKLSHEKSNEALEVHERHNLMDPVHSGPYSSHAHM